MSIFGYHIPILGYHRIGSFRDDHVPTVSAQAFERQLMFLKRRHCRVLSLDGLVNYLDHAQRIPRNSVVITFDDGYEETGTIAWPILKRFGFPATVFVTPSEVGQAGFATWAQVAGMAQDGVTIGSHTMNHSYLPLVDDTCLYEELVASKREIETHIGREVRFISYPVGGFTPQVQALAKQAGYLGACTTNRGSSRRTMDRYALRRIKVTERDANPFLFWAKVCGYYDCFRQLSDPA